MSKTKVERNCDLCGKPYLVDIGTYNKLMSGSNQERRGNVSNAEKSSLF